LNAYADTSLLISLYGRDVNTLAAISLVQSHHPTFFLTPFGEAEFTNGIELRLFQGQWTPPEVRSVLDDFRSDVGAGVIRLEELPPEVWPLTMTLSRRHSAKLGTRTLDVLHVASALILKPDVFLTFDDRQRKLARAEGMRVLPAPSRKRGRWLSLAVAAFCLLLPLALFLQFGQLRQHFRTVTLRTHARPHLDDLPLRVDQKRVAVGDLHVAHTAQRAVLLHYFLVGIS
jgi:predicted nucleic acid-binding protein